MYVVSTGNSLQWTNGKQYTVKSVLRGHIWDKEKVAL